MKKQKPRASLTPTEIGMVWLSLRMMASHCEYFPELPEPLRDSKFWNQLAEKLTPKKEIVQ